MRNRVGGDKNLANVSNLRKGSEEAKAMITLESHICQDLDVARAKEWIETNGIGGFASSTIIGLNTRRYHGLLVASLAGETYRRGRFVLLSKFEETVVTREGTFDISANQYPGVIHPQGHQYLKSFRLDPFPRFVYVVGSTFAPLSAGLRIEKAIFMVHGENTTVVIYRVLSQPDNRNKDSGGAKLALRPLLAFRDYHSLTRENEYLDQAGLRQRATVNARSDRQAAHRYEGASGGQIEFFPYKDMPSLYLGHSAGDFRHDPCWYNNFEYAREIERGLDCHEDLFSPGTLTLRLTENEPASVIASTEPLSPLDVQEMMRAEIKRSEGLMDAVRKRFSYNTASSGEGLTAGPSSRPKQSLRVDSVAPLWRAADSFLIRRHDGRRSIIAGYHWFTDWGRDTMISLPGLTLVTGRHDVAEEILKTYADYCDRGMIPNTFPDHGERPEYNTMDATLWLFYAVHEYLRACLKSCRRALQSPNFTQSIRESPSGDASYNAADRSSAAPGGYDFVRYHLFDAMKKIIDCHRRGTRYNIRMDGDCLLSGGDESTQLTWMDAKVGDWVVTPRNGKPVEINALWYNALRIAQSLAERFGENEFALECSKIAEGAKQSFNRLFWNQEKECLYDCVDGDTESSHVRFDDSVRPNQIFAVSLPYSLLPREKERKVIKRVLEDLYTPFGLRSLSPDDKDYIGRYRGDQISRDGAYHQGTVWAWLIGHFISAYLKVNDGSPAAMQSAMSFLQPFVDHLIDAGMGTISEIFDGAPPHAPRGCISQAWSVAEVLRAYCEIVRSGSNVRATSGRHGRV